MRRAVCGDGTVEGGGGHSLAPQGVRILPAPARTKRRGFDCLCLGMVTSSYRAAGDSQEWDRLPIAQELSGTPVLVLVPWLPDTSTSINSPAQPTWLELSLLPFLKDSGGSPKGSEP